MKMETKMINVKETNPRLLLTFHFSHRTSVTVISTKLFTSPMEANDIIGEAMGRSSASICIPGWHKGRDTLCAVNLNEVAFVTIDPVPSEGDAE